MKRALVPHLNPAGYMAGIGALYAAAIMIWNAAHHHGIIDPQVIVAALGAFSALLTRQVVTPVADPRDGNGNPLAALPPAVVMPLTATSTTTPPATGGPVA